MVTQMSFELLQLPREGPFQGKETLHPRILTAGRVRRLLVYLARFAPRVCVPFCRGLRGHHERDGEPDQDSRRCENESRQTLPLPLCFHPWPSSRALSSKLDFCTLKLVKQRGRGRKAGPL